MKLGLVKYDAMCKAIGECIRVDEAKTIRDKAMALEKYYAQAENKEAERQAINVRLRAERRCGELLKEMKANGERAKGGERRDLVEGCDEVPTLSDLGISRDQASRFQQVAEIPQAEFDEALADPANKPSTASLTRRKKAEPKMHPDILWLWGRLREFERRDMFSRKPQKITAEMTAAMSDDVRRLAPRIADWLGKI